MSSLLLIFGTLLGNSYDQVLAKMIVSTVVRLGDVAYYMHSISSTVRSRYDFPAFEHDMVAEPCTVLSVKDEFPTTDEIQSMLRNFDEKDDVWSFEFVQCIVVQMTESDRSLTSDEMKRLRELGANTIRSFHTSAQKAELPQGPYFIHYGHIHQAYRLYPDTAGAFVVSTVPDDSDR